MACITAQLLYLLSSVSLGVSLTLYLDIKFELQFVLVYNLFIMTVTNYCQLTPLGSVTRGVAPRNPLACSKVGGADHVRMRNNTWLENQY